MAEHIKKRLRHGKELDLDALKKELGDALWYISVMSYELGFSLEEVAADNIASKLYTDGLVCAGVLAGDDWRRVRGVAVYSHKGKETGITITIYPAQAQEVIDK